MKHNTLKILFLISRTRKRADGKVPLICRLTFAGVRKQFYTGLYIPIGDWSSKKQHILRGKYVDYNSHINYLRQQLDHSYLELLVAGNSFKVQDIYYKYITNKSPECPSVMNVFSKYCKYQRSQVGYKITISTYRKYRETQGHILSYIKNKYKKDDIDFDLLKKGFLEDLDVFLSNIKGLQQSTVNKTIQRFRTVLKYAQSEGFMLTDPFIMFRYKRVRKDLVYLSEIELSRIEKLSTNIKRIDKIKSLFIFCCYTGLGFKEMRNLEKTDVEQRLDGSHWLKVRRHKTRKVYSLPLLPNALKVILEFNDDHSDLVFPGVSNQKFNAYLKEIADLCGINKKLTHHIARKTFATTILLANGISMDITSKMLGHSSIKTTQSHYGEIIDSTLGDAMIKVNDTLKSKNDKYENYK